MNGLLKTIYAQKLNMLRVVAVLIIFALTLSLEQSLNTLQIDQSKSFINVYKGEGLQVSYKKTPDYENFSGANKSFPRFIRADKPLTVEFFEDTYLSMDAGTELRTIKFQKNRLHLELTKGSIIFDNRISQQPVTLQVGNLFLQPFKVGTYYLHSGADETSVTSLSGVALIGVHDDAGKLEQKRLLAKQNRIRFLDYEDLPQFGLSDSISSDTSTFRASSLLIDIDKEVSKATIFGLLYKGNLLDPIQNKFQSNLFESLTFNKEKKHLYSIYPYLQNLRQAEEALIIGNKSQAASHLENAQSSYIDIVAGDADLVLKANKMNEEQLEYLYGIQLEDSLYEIKKFHLETIKPKKSEAILSLLEDLDQAYARKETIELESILDLLSKITADLKDENNMYFIEILDNMSSKYLVANNSSHIALRGQIGDNLTKKSDLIAYKASSIDLMRALQTYYRNDELPASEIKKAATILLEHLDQSDQVRFQNFVAELSAAE